MPDTSARTFLPKSKGERKLMTNDQESPINENMVRVARARQLVREHPLCFSLTEDDQHYVALFPYTVLFRDGVRVCKLRGKEKALQSLYAVLERYRAVS